MYICMIQNIRLHNWCLPFSTGVQENYAQCSLLFLHAEHDPLHTDAVFWLVWLGRVNGHQVIPPNTLVSVTRIVKKACQGGFKIIQLPLTIKTFCIEHVRNVWSSLEKGLTGPQCAQVHKKVHTLTHG